MKAHLLTVIVALFLGGFAMADEVSVDKDLIFIWYEGPADLGSVKMFLSNKGKVEVEYSHFAMIKSKTAPWQKTVDLGPKRVANLFRKIQERSVKPLKLPTLTLLPGQEMALKTLRAGVGKNPFFINHAFIEIPPVLAELMEELRSIYEEVRGDK